MNIAMTSTERVLAVLKGIEPDQIPTFEIDIDQRVIDHVRPGVSYAEFCDSMDLDAICYYDMKTMRYEAVDESAGIVKDEWGAYRRFSAGSRSDAIPIEPFVKNRADLKKLQVPDPDAPHRYEAIVQAVAAFKGVRAVIATVYDPFATVAEAVRGEVNLYKDMIQAPEFVDELQEVTRGYHLRYVRNCIDLGVDAIWVTGDYAMTKGPMVSPKFTERFLTPGLKQIVDYCHSRGVPCLKHTDGNIWSIFDLILDTGIDGIHPIDPAAGMDIGEAKERYGDRVCLVGGIDCGPLLSWSTPEEVQSAVLTAIRKAGRGGRYVCASSNSIHGAVRPENYVAMIKAVREHGVYPLAVLDEEG